MAAIPNDSSAFLRATENAVEDSGLRRKLENASRRHLDHVAETYAEFPQLESERGAARKIKDYAIAHLDELLIQFKAAVEAKGGKVFFASDAAEARAYLVDLARRNQVGLVVKGKS